MKKIIVVALLALAACEQRPITAPTGGFKCGPQAQECKGGGCCSLSEECGGVWPNCPAGYCCANEDNGRVFGVRRQPDAGSK